MDQKISMNVFLEHPVTASRNLFLRKWGRG